MVNSVALSTLVLVLEVVGFEEVEEEEEEEEEGSIREGPDCVGLWWEERRRVPSEDGTVVRP